MNSTIGVVVGTYGDRLEWSRIAQRAIRSIHAQTRKPDDWIHVHGGSLADARNKGAEILGTDQLIFLDADDELDSRYVEAMMFNAELSSNRWTIWRPSTIGVYPDGSTDESAVMIPASDLKRRNCIVIGAMCPADAFFEVGGFSEDPVLEDWDLWIRCVRSGVAISETPQAIYRVFVNPNGRNQVDPALHGRVYSEILRRYLW